MSLQPFHRCRACALGAITSALTWIVLPPRVAAQTDTGRTPSPLAACAAAAERREFALAERIGAEQAQGLSEQLRRRPDDVSTMVTLARVISQCRIPGAELMQQADLSAEAIELLASALTLEPRHWYARYLLALHYFRSPSFMRRGELAAQEFDKLIELQDGRTAPGEFARPYEYRGVLWLRADRPDSARSVWKRGLALFPSDTGLLARLAAIPDRRDDTPSRASEGIAAEAPPGPTAIAPVTVRATPSPVPPALANVRVVQRMDVLMAPGATADILQAMQLQGGSTMVGDGADLHARGGDPSETPLLLNGARVLGAVRFESFDGSLFGAIDPHVVRSARFAPGGFTVRVGDALSGVLEVETEGRPRSRQYRAGLSSVTASATVQRPASGRSGGWVSARVSHTGPMLRMNGRSTDYPLSPRSVDLIAGVTVEPDPRTEVRLVALGSSDDVSRNLARADVTGSYRASGATGAMVLQYRRLAAHAPLITRAALSISGRSSSQALGVLDRTRSDALGSVTTDVEMQVASSTLLRVGGVVSLFMRRERGVVPTTASLALDAPSRELDGARESASHVGVWAESAVERGRFSWLAGLRADRVPLGDRITLDPRLSAAVTVGATRLHATIGRFHQGAWRPVIEAPSPVRLHDVPTAATHYVLGAEADGAVRWRLDAFLKTYGDYAHRAGPSIETGRVRGVEVVLRRAPLADRMIDGWITYSAAQSRVRLTDGGQVPATYDVSHAVVVVASWRVLARTRLGLTTRAATGAPTTVIAGSDSTSIGWLPRYASVNDGRIPGYARADVRLTQFVPFRGGLAVCYVEAINMLDRRNVTGYVYDATWRQRTPVEQFFSRRTYVIGLEWTRQ